MLTAHPPATDHTDHSQMPGSQMFNRRGDSRGAQPHHSPGQMNEQFRQSSLESPSGYGPGHTSRGELRDESQEPYRINRVAKGTTNVGQTGDPQPKGGYYSQQEIDGWEMGPSSQWTGGYDSYQGGPVPPHPGYGAGPAQWTVGMQPVQQTQQQAYNMFREQFQGQRSQQQRQQSQ